MTCNASWGKAQAPRQRGEWRALGNSQGLPRALCRTSQPLSVMLSSERVVGHRVHIQLANHAVWPLSSTRALELGSSVLFPTPPTPPSSLRILDLSRPSLSLAA